MNSDSQSTQSTDPVCEVLRAWFLPGWWAGLAAFEAPWGIAVPEGRGSLYLVLAGSCCVTFADSGLPVAIEAGDVLLLGQGQAYCVQDAPESPTVPYPAGFTHCGARWPAQQSLTGSTRLVFGHFT